MNHQDDLLKTMLITANVGTIFEESSLLDLWFKQLKTYLDGVQPQFVAIHCQEVGGKNFANSMKDMSIFTDKITGDQDIANSFNRIRIFLDEDYTSPERFTALGSIYLVHNTVRNFKIYNFETNNFDTIQDISVNTFNQNKSSVEHVEKVKFPQDLFPECRWSRKGFMRTRWLFNDRQMVDLVNIHLFHDASNLVAMEATPSPYALDRQRALDFTLRKISEPLKIDDTLLKGCQEFFSTQQQMVTDNLQVPLFIFGDFNFRLDTKKVIERISRGASPKIKRCADSNEVLQFVYHLDENDPKSLTADCCSGQKSFDLTQTRKTSTMSNPEVVMMTTTTAATTTTITTTSAKANEPKLKLETQIPTLRQQEQQSHHQPIPLKHLDTSSSSSFSSNITTSATCMPPEELASGATETPTNTPIVMTIGKKLFDFVALDETFRAVENNEWLQEMDNELNSFRSELFEFKISFSPSYPFKEDTSGAHSYMKTRCPAWCDRILFNSAGSKVIHLSKDNNSEKQPPTATSTQETTTKDTSKEHIDVIRERVELLQNLGNIQYRLLGNSSPMGDHKPVLLYCQLSI